MKQSFLTARFSISLPITPPGSTGHGRPVGTGTLYVELESRPNPVNALRLATATVDFRTYTDFSAVLPRADFASAKVASKHGHQTSITSTLQVNIPRNLFKLGLGAAPACLSGLDKTPGTTGGFICWATTPKVRPPSPQAFLVRVQPP